MTLKDKLFGRFRKEDTGIPTEAAGEKGRKKPRTGTIGKYDIVEKIGSGGFGTVYKGWDPVIKRHVAIKTCEVGSKDIRTRFFREAQLAGGLQHPNITFVYEFGFEGDVPFLVQEFLSGEDLDRMIKAGTPLPLQDKLKILIGVVFGLEYAHKAGVMHRDVKPANVRVLDNQSVKIMDFGIAKSVDPSGDITMTGITVGSSSYMSPEQIGGDAIDFRTDIFSFGILAYELLSYRKPFRNENLFLLLEQIVKEDPVPLSEVAPDLPPALVEVVEKAMAKNPEDRFASAKDLRNALIAVQQQIPSSEATAARLHTVRHPEDDSVRLRALERLEILDTEPDPAFDDLARLAAQVCGAPFAVISLVDQKREWFKSRIGISTREVPRDTAFGTQTILQHDVLELPDASADERFTANPLVTAAPNLRFYAGAPLTTDEGFSVGTLAVFDVVPRELSRGQLESLRSIARQVVAQLELRRLRRSDREQSGEKLILEAAGLGDDSGTPPAAEKVQ
ncbi:MAG: GAF domain-containing serine/threonine-protein kinase [Acidobacteriota bacterium]|nr:GAF domain-containing serine/threonine-protein kinase [Acidobacteriota bacterium]